MNENQDLRQQLYFGINYTIIRLKTHTKLDEGALYKGISFASSGSLKTGTMHFLCFTLKQRINIPQGSDSELQIEQLFEKTLQILVQYQFIILL